jgi:membrane AbrB-like protein
MKRLFLLLGAAGIVGWLFTLARIPVGWLLGAMVTGVVSAALFPPAPPPAPNAAAAVPVAGRTQTAAAWQVPSACMTLGQVLMGLSTGLGFPLASLELAAAYAVPLLVAVLITGGLSLCNGYLLHRWAGVDRATGFLGSLPGAAGAMVAMSDEMGADGVAVAMLQYLRLLLVLFLAPVGVSLFFPDPGTALAPAAAASAALPAAPLWLNAVVLVAAAALGGWGGQRLRVPSPTFLGPFLAVLPAAWFLPWQFYLPAPLFAGGMVLMGVAIGVRFDAAAARKLGRAAVIETGLVIVLILACLGAGFLFHLASGVDPTTAALGSTPGGMDVMVATASELGGNPGLVLAMQIARWFAILLAGPWVAARLARRGPGHSVA